MIITRFAPSPTGYLHVGGLRTALYSYLIAKQVGGKFLLRIEDTDRERFVSDGTTNILKSLYWAGLIPDEGVKMDCLAIDECSVVEEGKNGPYVQSERLDIYKKYADELVKSGDAYPCFCTEDRLSKVREIRQIRKMPTGYDGFCRDINKKEAAERVATGEKHVIRFKMPKTGETVFDDLVRGEVSFKNELIDDQVIIKSDGFPTYHLAVVVDDHLMGVTHIVRGEEWLSSVPKHIQLFKALSWEIPKMAHLPLLLNADKSKLSKRQGDVAVGDYKKAGYLPEALINFVAFLGWNPGDEREIFSLEELIKEFTLEKVGKAGSVFNLEKLDWYNQQYLRRLSDKDFAGRSVPFLTEAGLLKEEENWSNDKEKQTKLIKILNLEKERIVKLTDLPGAIRFAFVLPDYPADLLVWKKSTHDEAKNIITRLFEKMNKISVQAWNKVGLEKEIGEWIKESGLSNGLVLWPLRVSLSGQDKSPGPYEIADALGKEESIRRLSIALEKL